MAPAKGPSVLHLFVHHRLHHVVMMIVAVSYTHLDVYKRQLFGRVSVFSSLGSNLLLRPVELGSIDPHAMQNDGELTGDRNLGLAEPVALGEPCSPSFERRPFRHAGQQHPGSFEQIHAEHGVTAL